jgi:hypothetical protein
MLSRRTALAGPALTLALVAACALAPARGGEPPDPAERAWAACARRFTELKLRCDYDAARSVLRAFLARHANSPHAEEARREIRELDPYAERQIKASYDNARTFSDRRQFEVALELYTEIIMRAPSPAWVEKARQGIEHNDKAVEAYYQAVRKECDRLVTGWKFAEAVAITDKAAAEMAGTKWVAPTLRLREEAEGSRAFFAGLIAKVEASQSDPKTAPFRVKDPTGWLVTAKIVAADERGFTCLAGGAGKSYTWEEMLPGKGEDPPKRFLEIVDLYKLTPGDQFSLGIFLLRRGYKKAATARFEIAAKDADLAERAKHYVEVISGSLNRLLYDFGSGLQLMDWRATGGRWRLARGELVQEADDGEAELLLEKHEYEAREVRFFFDLTARSSGGLISVVFAQDEKNSFGFAFSPSDGYSAFASIDGRIKTAKDAKFRLPAGKKVRVRCGLKGDTFALSVGTVKLPRLSAPGISALKGRFRIRTLDAAAGFDNVDIRNRVAGR